MRRIDRRYLTRDPNGRAIAERSERLTDDGQGWTQLVSEQTARRCSGCLRPVVDLNELRGMCDGCHARGCCAHCVSTCKVCSRQLCGKCRHGFAGPPAMTVCEICHHRLMYRQAVQDQQAMQQTAFERNLAQQRLLNQIEGLRLAADRLHLSAQFQAARLGLTRPPTLFRRSCSMIWQGFTKVYNHVGSFLR